MEPDHQGAKASSVIVRRLKNLFGRLRPAPAPVAAVPLPPPPGLADEVAALGSALEPWVRARAAQDRLYASLTDARVHALSETCPAERAGTIAAADRVLRHEFDLLGSGPFTPVDPNRAAVGGYRPIDWYLDPIQGLRFPELVPHDKWNLLEMRPGLADVKLPWELGRCQHWLPLAQAYGLTGDSRYGLELLDQHDDFMQANPVGLGINWTCTMDVAIRALNWALALEIVQHGSLDRVRIAGAYESIFAHGHFIERNLENKYEVTSNHFLSNVVGLFAVAELFRDLPSGVRWTGRCREWLEQEMRVQVLDDGMDYESSVPYHRLVAELFLSGWRIAEVSGRPLSPGYQSKLRAMLQFLHDVLRPDGKLPQIGDADDGRVHVFSGYGTWDPQDARHLFAPASVLLGEPAWLDAAGPWGRWEAAWWGVEAATAAAGLAPVDRLFPDAGIVVARDRRSYLLITNGKVGTNGFGNHKHNDLLSFEFHDRGVPLFVDPGSYVYTSDPEARNRFRSTRAHNTVTVDGQEQNDFKTEWLFRMFQTAAPTHVAFSADTNEVRYRGSHDGYTRFAPGVTHEREFHLDRVSGRLHVTDELRGSGEHRLAWRFQCAPGVGVTIDIAGVAMLSAAGRRWQLVFPAALAVKTPSAWYSPSYGVRQPATAIDFAADVNLSRERVWSFVLEAVA